LTENNHTAKQGPNAKPSPALEVLAHGLGEQRASLRAVQRFLTPGSVGWRKHEKQIDAIDRRLAALLTGGSPSRKIKRVQRRNKPVKKIAARLVESPLADAATSESSRSIFSPIAAKRMEAYRKSKGIGLTEFASQVGASERTIRRFRKVGKLRLSIFGDIARVMKTTKEELLKTE
jgi:hypothetical protein